MIGVIGVVGVVGVVGAVRVTGPREDEDIFLRELKVGVKWG
jgi:hypothetical protein